MTTQKPKQQKEAGAVLCAGLFVVVTGDQATAHILTDSDVTAFYEGTRFARVARDPESAMLQVIRKTFRAKDALFALPAPDKAHLEDLFERYDGPAQLAVRVLAASWLTGVPFKSFDDNKGGATDRLPESPIPPPPPAGSDKPESIKPQLEPHEAPSTDSLTLDSLLAMVRP